MQLVYSMNQPQVSKYLFIDGNCFQRAVEDLSNTYSSGMTPEIDYNQLRMGCDKAFYYDALPSQKESEAEDNYQDRYNKKRTFLDKISSTPRFHVRCGTTRRQNKRQPQQQKMVDVQLAVDMMKFAYQQNYKEAKIIAGDMDFVPLIEALVDLGFKITLYYPLRFTTAELKIAADTAEPMTIDWLAQFVTSSFRSRIQIPSSRTVHLSQLSSMPVEENIQKWQDEDGSTFTIDRNLQCFRLNKIEHSSDHFKSFEFGSLELLKRYVEDSHGICVPAT